MKTVSKTARITRLITLGSIGLAALLLSSCATLPAQQAAANRRMEWPVRVRQLSAINNWDIKGAIAVHTREKGWSASLNWQQLGNLFKIKLFGPLGAGHVELDGKPNNVKLLTADNKTFRADSPEQLLMEHVGWRIPISNIRYWVRGIPVPDQPYTKTVDRYNHLQSMDQAGWDIKYLRYTAVSGIDMPSKIYLQSSRLNVRVVISNWQIS